MDESKDLICRIHNRSGLELHVSGESEPISNKHHRWFKLDTNTLTWSFDQGRLSVRLDGSEVPTGQLGHQMCFCFSPDTSIQFVLNSSMGVTILPLEGDVGDVKCGEG
jgi:hypothetical protein